MSTTVATDKLREHVVRLAVPGGSKILGTGVFAAPGWVLTCAHVVGEHDRVELCDWSGRPVAADAEVMARSQHRDPKSPSNLWPFPDLALVRFDGDLSHPVALLDPDRPPQPGEDRDCVAWGYARREHGVDPVGSPAALRFQGIEGDEFLSLKAGLAMPGLSGAPLVSPHRRAVVGVISATRSASNDLGGWASPLWPLTRHLDRIPRELADYGQRVLEANREAVLRDRSSWHAVLPVAGRTDLETSLMTWGEYRRGKRSDPADLLLPEYRVVRYLFRDDELADLEAWCLSAEPMSIAVLPGLGGSGKTRTAIELCAKMLSQGWVAGEIPRTNAERTVTDLVDAPLPRLAVLDYVEGLPVDELRTWIGRLRASATDISPVRMLLLNRVRGGSTDSSELTMANLRLDATVTVKRLLDDRRSIDGATSELDQTQRTALFREALRGFSGAWSVTEPASAPTLAGESYAEPLGVLFEALSLVLAQEASNGPPDELDADSWPATPAGRVLSHEEVYWRQDAPNEDDHLLRHYVALSTLTGAATKDDAVAMLSSLPWLADEEAAGRRHRISLWLSRLYGRGGGFWNPLRPDRLGEALVVQSLKHEHAAETLRRALKLSTADQLESALTVLSRCASGDAQARVLIHGVVAENLPTLIARAEHVAPGQASPSAGRTGVVTALVGLLASVGLADLALREPDNPSYQRNVAISLTNLGELARAVGDSAQALDLYQRTLTILEGLAARDPDNTTHERDLSVSLRKLGDVAVAVGDSTQARDRHQRAQAISEELVARDPDNTTYQRDLSVSLNTQGDLAVAVGDSTKARDLYQRAQAISEELVARDPDNTTHQRDIAVTLHKLGNLARAGGDSTRARDLYQRTLTISEELAARDPDNTTHQRDIAVTLNKLGNLARAGGDSTRARDLYQRTLTISEELAARDPDNTTYQRDVAISLERLGDLAVASDDSAQAHDLYQRSLTISEELAGHEPDNTTYQRDIAVTLNKLGDLAHAAGDGIRARDLYQRAQAISEELVARDPDNTTYQRDLSVSLNTQGDLAVAVGDSAKARDLYQRSLTIRENLSARDPDNTTYQRDLAVSLERLGDLAHAAGDSAQAHDLYQRSLTISEELAARDPDNTTYQRDIAVTLNKLGALAHAAGDSTRARDLYQRSLTIRENLSARDPDTT